MQDRDTCICVLLLLLLIGLPVLADGSVGKDKTNTSPTIQENVSLSADTTDNAENMTNVSRKTGGHLNISALMNHTPAHQEKENDIVNTSNLKNNSPSTINQTTNTSTKIESADNLLQNRTKKQSTDKIAEIIQQLTGSLDIHPEENKTNKSATSENQTVESADNRTVVNNSDVQDLPREKNALTKASEAWYLQGLNASKEGRYEDAARNFAVAIRVDNRSDATYTEYAKVLSKLGRESEAEDAVREAIRINSSNTQAIVNLGKILNTNGNCSEAASLLKNASEKEEKNTDILNQLADSYNRQGRSEDALGIIRRSLEITDEQAGAWSTFAAILFSQGKFYEALSTDEKALTLDPSDASSWVLLGDINNQLGEYNRSLEAYAAALSHEPNNTAIYRNIGSVLEKEKMPDEAKIAYAKAGNAQNKT